MSVTVCLCVHSEPSGVDRGIPLHTGVKFGEGKRLVPWQSDRYLIVSFIEDRNKLLQV